MTVTLQRILVAWSPRDYVHAIKYYMQLNVKREIAGLERCAVPQNAINIWFFSSLKAWDFGGRTRGVQEFNT